MILTGRHPSHSGIVANDWFDATLGRAVNVVDDARHRPLGGAGRAASPMHLGVDTIGDLLKIKNPQSRVVGVSLKDRSAILMGGRRADAAYWYETNGGNFITSTYYMAATPGWLTDWNGRHMADGYAGHTWNRLLPDAEAYGRYAGQDAIEGEWDRKDTSFPHAIRGRPPEVRFYDDLRRTPFADELTLAFALEAMQAHHIGVDEVTDLLAIGFSATDIVGHTYGPDSHETMDQLLRLDAALGRLFKAIDANVGMANTLMVLTSDHGSLPLVENLLVQGMDARRASPSVLRGAVEQAFAHTVPWRHEPDPVFLLTRLLSEREGDAAQQSFTQERGRDGECGAADHGPGRTGLHPRRLETGQAFVRSVSAAVPKFLLRTAKPASERPAEAVGLRQHASRRNRPRHRIRL